LRFIIYSQAEKQKHKRNISTGGIFMKIALWAAIAALPLSGVASAATPAKTKTASAKAKAAQKPATGKADNPLTCSQQTASGLRYTELTPGKGDGPAAEDAVSVNYTGRLATNGTEFDSGKDSKFAVGGVIPGFSEGLMLMKPGARYRLCIPAALAYGDQDKGTIPPNSDLVFEVDLLSVIKKPVPVVQIIPETERICDQKTASGLGYKTLKSGLGDMATEADVALVNITVYEPDTGKVLEGRDWQQIPVPSAVPGVNEALRMMKIGSSYRFCVPGTLLSQQPGEESKAPAMINFHIDLIDTKKIADFR
jgi:FKBP-type peptidyl-prolyl cis-trans isomerase FkpA